MQRNKIGQNAKKAQWIYVKPTNAANVIVKAYLYKEGSTEEPSEIPLGKAPTGEPAFEVCLHIGGSLSRSWSR
jgi:hypothetical protein